MIVSPRFPYLEIRVTVRGHEVQDWAYIDTGFDGYVVVPHDQDQVFGPGDYASLWELGDTSLAQAEEYLGQVQLVGTAEIFLARVTALGNEYIIGRALLDRWRILLDRGQRVEVEINLLPR